MTDVSTTPNGIAQLSTETKHAQAESMSSIILRRFFKHRMAVIGTMIMSGIVLFLIIGAFVYPEIEGNTPDPTAPFVAPTLESLYNDAPVLAETEIPSLVNLITYDQALALLDEAVQYQMITERDREAILAGTENANRFDLVTDDAELLKTLKIFEGLRL
ncbi:MAG TPA: hypothetical protein PLZ51_22460, partial [Aggregatilineales bacterium]|nr:hypothetical protein [Aggregatilineales bacterium]